MAEISIVSTKDFGEHLIIAPEWYFPAKLQANSILQAQSQKRVRDYFAEITVLQEPDSTPLGVEIFDLTDTLSQFLAAGEVSYSINSSKKRVAPDDLIISRLRSYLREVSIIPKRGNNFLPLVSTEFIVLRPLHNRQDSHWLLPYLLSQPAQTVLRWSQTGTNHPRFPKFVLLDIPIPDALLGIQSRIATMITEALTIYENGLTLYPEAEAELLNRLEWDKLTQPDELFYIEELSELNKRERIDAEHFQPKYRRLREHLQARGAERLGSFCTIPGRGVQPMFSERDEIWVIDSKSVRPQGVEPSETDRVSREFYESPKGRQGRIQKDDVLLNGTGLGTLGRAACYQWDKPALADNHVTILRPDASICSPLYLSLFLNSLPGQMQSTMFQTGSSGQLELYPQHVAQFLVFVPRNKNGSIDHAWQQGLAEKVRAASEAKNLARQKLNEATALVEEAIGWK